MTRRFAAAAISLCSASLLAGCGAGGTASLGTPRPTVRATPTAHPTPAPTPLPRGPFAILVANSQRSGTAYDVMIVDTRGTIVTRVTAQLPHLKPNQTVDLPLVSASTSRVYYLDGDTDIRSLSPAGTVALVKSIPDGAKSAITFAVSSDDLRIAVLVLTEQTDSTKDTGHGYIEDLAGTGNHLDLFNNIGLFSFRWPVGWQGTSVIDALGAAGCGPGAYGYPGQSCVASVSSYHVVDGVSGNRIAAVCESPSTASNDYNNSHYYSPQGSATPAGVACYENQVTTQNGTQTQVETMEAVDWTGHESDMLQKTFSPAYSGDIGLGSCFLAPDGGRMACTARANNATTLLAADGTMTNLGRRYTILGWIDAGHLMVDIDSSTLAVLTAASGALTTLSLHDAGTVTMPTPLPGAL